MSHTVAVRRPYQAPQFVASFRLAQITAAAAPVVSGTQVVSDRRLKTEIRYLETTDEGVRLYAYRYVWSRDVQVGVMAQDLLTNPKHRDAVHMTDAGFYVVDYAALGLALPVSLAEWEVNSAVVAKRPCEVPAYGAPVGLATVTALAGISGANNVG